MQLAVAWNAAIVYQYINAALQFVASGEKIVPFLLTKDAVEN